MDIKLTRITIDENDPLYKEVMQVMNDLDGIDPDEVKDPQDEPAKPRRKK